MNSIIDAVPNISMVTKIEVLGFNVLGGHYQLSISFTKDVTVLDLTKAIVGI